MVLKWKERKKIKCKYCLKVVTRGIYRLKHHLAGTQKDVEACRGVIDEVRKEMWEVVATLQEKLIKKSNENKGVASRVHEDIEVVGEKRKRQEVVENPVDLFKNRGVSSQLTINSVFKKSLREDACQEIASFFLQ